MGGGNFKISWRTDSYASIEQYRLLYRKAPAPVSIVALLLNFGISLEFFFLDKSWSEFCLDKCCHTWSPAHHPGQEQEQGHLHPDPVGHRGRLPGPGTGKECLWMGQGVQTVHFQNKYSRYFLFQVSNIASLKLPKFIFVFPE